MFSFNTLFKFTCLWLFAWSAGYPYAAVVEIIKISGTVQVRHGLEEKWNLTLTGATLREMDSITTGPESEATLRTSDGLLFTLGANAMIDIADLRRITEQEMFLFIMSQKIEKLAAPGKKTGLEIGSVSVIHGIDKATQIPAEMPDAASLVREMNGALALQQQRFYTNAVVKYHKLLRQDRQPLRQSLIRYELGCCFEQLQQPGQALDAFQTARELLLQQDQQSDDVKNQLWRVEAALTRLKENQN